MALLILNGSLLKVFKNKKYFYQAKYTFSSSLCHHLMLCLLRLIYPIWDKCSQTQWVNNLAQLISQFYESQISKLHPRILLSFSSSKWQPFAEVFLTNPTCLAQPRPQYNRHLGMEWLLFSRNLKKKHFSSIIREKFGIPWGSKSW